MSWQLWLALSVLLTWFVLVNGYIVYMAASAVLERGQKLNWFMKIPAVVLVLLGLPADVIFNWIAGTILFRERPHEWVFTARCKRHKAGQDGWRKDKAMKWCAAMNKFGFHC